MANTQMEPHNVKMNPAEKSKFRQQFMVCFMNAMDILHITDYPNRSPTFEEIEKLMTLRMGLEEQKEEIRDDIWYFLQYEVDSSTTGDFTTKL